jgi:hypothetical protein
MAKDYSRVFELENEPSEFVETPVLRKKFRVTIDVEATLASGPQGETLLPSPEDVPNRGTYGATAGPPRARRPALPLPGSGVRGHSDISGSAIRGNTEQSRAESRLEMRDLQPGANPHNP